EVGDCDEGLAGRDEVVGGDGNGVDGAGFGRADVEAVVTALRGSERGFSVGHLRFDAGLVGWAVTLGAAKLKALHGAVGGLKALFGGGDFAGGGGACLLELPEGGEIFCGLLLLLLGSRQIGSE